MRGYYRRYEIVIIGENYPYLGSVSTKYFEQIADDGSVYHLLTVSTFG